MPKLAILSFCWFVNRGFDFEDCSDTDPEQEGTSVSTAKVPRKRQTEPGQPSQSQEKKRKEQGIDW